MKKIGFIAGQDGAVVKYDSSKHAPKPTDLPVSLTRHQRATLYFKALRLIESLFRDVGFRALGESGHGWFTSELGMFILEMKVEEPRFGGRIAHVTSFPGYNYDPERITAKVTMMGPDIPPGEYVIRITGSFPDEKGRLKGTLPTYVIIDPRSQDPLREAFASALAAAHDFISQDPATLERIKEALAKRDIQKDFDRFLAEDEGRGQPGGQPKKLPSGNK